MDALGRMGTEKANDYLTGMLNENHDNNTKYSVLSGLSRHKYAKALPFSTQFLKEDMEQSYWMLIFIFGKYGNSCIPFLMGNVNNKDKNIRYNSIYLLGNILLYDQLVPELWKQYGNEKDADIRKLIITVSINLLHDKNAVFEFLEKVLKTEKDKAIVELAQKYRDDRANIENQIHEYKKSKKINKKDFEKQYDRSIKSFGKECDFYALGIVSDVNDENRLVEVRENLLVRSSDECLYDLNKINIIILYNRLITRDK